jgi:hypothetical protein
MRRLLLPLATIALATGPLGAQNQADHRAVREAVLDYVEAIYEVKPERIARSVHPTLVKQGMARGADGNTYRGPLPMNYQQLYDLAATWNKDNRNADPATAPKVIEVYDVQDATAMAKLTASWGTDYFQLMKLEGKWMIMQIVWQTPMARN